MRTKHGHVHWNELNTTDIGEAGAFYGAVLGWKIDEVSEGGTKGWLIRKDGDTVGGAFALDGPEFDGMMSHWFTLFAVSDIETAVAEVRKSGRRGYSPPVHSADCRNDCRRSRSDWRLLWINPARSRDGQLITISQQLR